MRPRRLLAILLAGVLLAPGLARPGTQASEFCSGPSAKAKGDGASSQVTVHIKIFSKRFAAACRREAGFVTYLGTGTRHGIEGLTARALPFASSDVPLTTTDWLIMMKSSTSWYSPVHQIPLLVDGWAIAYNIPCRGPAVKFRSNVLALIYSGVLTRWDDDALLLDNPWLEDCAQTIRIARRVDDAAATDAFQDYLSKRNPNWIPYRRGLTAQRWPTSNFACSGLGDRGMRSCISSFRGAVGYMGIAAARASKLKLGLVENASRSFVPPSPNACGVAAETAVPPPGTGSATVPGAPYVPATMGDWSTVSITDAPDPGDGRQSYPICSFGYVFILQNWLTGYAASLGGDVLRSVADYFLVALRPSTQRLLTAAGYAPLPENIRRISEDGLNAVAFSRSTTGPL